MSALMLLGILVGIHIGFAFGIMALVGNVLLLGIAEDDWWYGLQISLRGVGSVAYEYLRTEVFAAIPLFMLLGDFVKRSGAAKDLYTIMNKGLKAIPGRLAVATVAGNAVFAAVTGVSIAAAAAFSRIAYPQMRHHRYDRRFALGSVAGSACLGMIIPPSVLLIVWGIITEKSIAQLFMAGAVPGLILALFFMIYIGIAATVKPELAPAMPAGSGDDTLGVREVRQRPRHRLPGPAGHGRHLGRLLQPDRGGRRRRRRRPCCSASSRACARATSSTR